MPPFPRFVPLPRQLLEDLPKPLAFGLDLAFSVPAAAVRVGQQALTQAITEGVTLLGRGVELGSSLLGRGSSLFGHDDPDSEDGADDEEDEPFPSYAGLDTSAWGAGDAGTDDPEAEPSITVEPGLAAAVADLAQPPASEPARQDLPVAGYDGLSLTALRSQLAGLSRAELETVRDYEAGHAKRVTVLALLERQIAKA